MAEGFTGRSGVYVELPDTIAAFKALVAGEVDDLPEQAFYMVGTLDDVRQRAEEMAKET